MATGGGAMSKRNELVQTNVYNMKNYFIAPNASADSLINCAVEER